MDTPTTGTIGTRTGSADLSDPATSPAKQSAAPAAATIALPAFENIALDDIALSPTPMQKARRAGFDRTKLEELATTIKEHGVIEPVLVRRIPAPKSGKPRFELVAGERRYCASRIAGAPTIPAIVRELTDLQVVEMQVIENNQREDLHELVEAEGFEQLINVHKLTVDAIAIKIGKSRSHVYGRLKLCRLCPEARAAFYEGKIEATLALEIARHITPHDLQRQALKEVTKKDYSGEVMSFRRAAEHIRQNYLVKLSAAPFDIKSETLVAKAGSCLKCPKSSGNQPELFQDTATANVCTDPTCFAAKRAAHAEVQRAAAIAKGQTVISGADAKKIAPAGTQYGLNGYHTLDSEHWTGKKTVKVKDVCKDVETVLLQDPKSGDLVPVVSNDQLRKALVAKGIHRTNTRAGSAGSSYSSRPSPQQAAANQREKLKRETETLYRTKLLAACHAKWKGPLTRADLELVAQDEYRAYGGEQIDTLYPTKTRSTNKRDFSGMTEEQIAGFIVLAVVSDEIQYGEAPNLHALAGRLKVDTKLIRAAAELELKTKADAEKPNSAKPAAKKKAAKSSAKKKPTAPAKKKAAKK